MTDKVVYNYMKRFPIKAYVWNMHTYEKVFKWKTNLVTEKFILRESDNAMSPPDLISFSLRSRRMRRALSAMTSAKATAPSQVTCQKEKSFNQSSNLFIGICLNSESKKLKIR